ncbi:MAG: RICIN domain-containing protein [Microcoleus sp.]
MQRQVKILVSLISIAFLASSLSRVEAQAEKQSRFFITNKVSNLCLGVLGVDGHGPGVRVEVFHCNPGGGDAGNDNQWTIKDLGNGYSHIINKVSNLCLGVVGVDGHGPGARVEVYHCNPGSGDAGNDNQWTIQPLRNGYSYIKNRVSGLCLGVVGVDDHWAGAAVEVYRCKPGSGDAGNDNQWTIKRISS